MPASELSRRSALTAMLAAPAILRGHAARAATKTLKFSLAAPFDGSTAPFFLGKSKGWYSEAGLDVAFDSSGGSGEAVSRVGSGVYDLGVGDLNVMAEFNAKNPASAIHDVYMLYFRSPLCVATLAKSGITKPSDLNGRKIGAAAPDGAYRMFPAYVKATGINAGSIAWDMVGLQLREAVLSRGDVDAILGFDSTMYFGLVKAGIAPSDIRFMYYSDVGLDLYGNGIMASDKLRREDPEALKRFVAVTARAWQASIANPAAAVAALMEQVPLLNAALETEKLQWLVKNQLVTSESKADGLGGVRTERLQTALNTLGTTYGFGDTLKPADVFDPAFLPSADLRKLPV